MSLNKESKQSKTFAILLMAKRQVSGCHMTWHSTLFKAHNNLLHPYNKKNWLIGLVSRVFANGPGDLGSIPGRVIP